MSAKRPKFSVRELVLAVALVAMTLAWGMAYLDVVRLRAEVNAANVIADAEQADAEAEVASLRAKLAECLERFGEAE